MDDKTPITEKAQWRGKALSNLRGLALSGPLPIEPTKWLVKIADDFQDWTLALVLVESWLRQQPEDLDAWNWQAGIESSLGAIDRAAASAQQVLAKKPNSQQLRLALITQNQVGLAHYNNGRVRDAVRLWEQIRDKQNETGALDEQKAMTLLNNLSFGYRSLRQWDKAVTLLESLVQRERQRQPPNAVELAGRLATLGDVLVQIKRFPEAEPVLRECLTLREKNIPADWRVFSTKSLLGESLLGQKKYAVAEPLLRAGYEGLKVRREALSPSNRGFVAQAAERLIQLYEAWDKPEEATKWRKELEALKAQSATEKKP
jgi:hypothetical protein